MTTHLLLGQLNNAHQLLVDLLESVPEPDCYCTYHPDLAPLAWYYGRSVYHETFWLREVVEGDPEMTARVRELFAPQQPLSAEQWGRLPPREHLLNWGMELQEENLTRLANPRLLPPSPLLDGDRLLNHLLQEQHRIYEKMLMALAERRLQMTHDGYRVGEVLAPRRIDHTRLMEVSKGHYRIGSKEPEPAFDNELPQQVVKLSSFRMMRRPVSNAEYLGFVEAGGYHERGLWSKAGWDWRTERAAEHPRYWRRDADGNWYGIGQNGPFDLTPEEPLLGITHHEAVAFASWVSGLGKELRGAVLQHEYQWEVALRTQALQELGRVWEWCAAPFHRYDGFTPSADGLGATPVDAFDGAHYALRGGSLFTQPSLRRPSYRAWAAPDAGYLFAGTRLVFPPL